MDSDSSAGDDDLDLVSGSHSPSASPLSIDDPYDFFDDDDDIDHQQHSEPIDRLSTLPNPTLLHIISFLPTKDAINTSSLSKKFQFMWTLSPTLSFFPHETLLDIRSFVTFVDQTLILHNSPKLTKFHLQFDYDNLFSPSVNRWITYALRRDVEEIDLDLLGSRSICEFDGNFFTLPVSLCNCSSLVKLSLNCVRFGDMNWEIRWNSLKCLSLGYMILDEALIRDILSSCHMLEDLVIRECSGFNRLDIGSDSLKRLRIYGYGDFCQSDTELEISCPSLRSLGIYGSFRRKIKCIDMKSLVDCTLNFQFVNKGSVVNANTSYIRGGNKFDHEDSCKLMVELLAQVCKVKNLTLGEQFIEVLSTAAWGRMELPALETRCLILEAIFYKRSFPAIWHLIMLSCHLEKLVLNFQTSGAHQTSCKFFIDGYYSSKPDSFSFLDRTTCLQHSLKTVEIKGFSGSPHEIEFAQSVLNHGKLLEKMVILCNMTEYKGLEESVLLEIVRKILSFKRASAKAVVLFSW